MSRTRWLFEAWQLRMKDAVLTKHVNTIGKQGLDAFRDIIISTLGLNLAPIADGPDPENPEKTKYRWPKDGEFTPMILAVAREDYAMSVAETVKDLIPAEVSESVTEVAEEDLEFFDNIDVDPAAFWKSSEMQEQLKSYVHLDEPPNANTAKPPTPPQPRPAPVQKQAKIELDNDLDFDDE